MVRESHLYVQAGQVFQFWMEILKLLTEDCCVSRFR